VGKTVFVQDSAVVVLVQWERARFSPGGTNSLLQQQFTRRAGINEILFVS